jgi:hypothetical protein
MTKRSTFKNINMTKTILIFLIMTLVAFETSAQSMDKVLRKYRNDEGVVSLNFGGDISRYMKSNEVKMKSKIESCDVLIFNDPNNVTSKDLIAIKKLLTDNKFDEMISVKDKRGKANIYTISKGETLSHVFGILKAEKRNIYITLTGNIYLEELSKLNMFFDGGNDLSKFLK